MLERFFPVLTLDKVQDISTEVLDKYDIKGLILDIDNTLVPPHMKEADDNAVKWIERMKSEGFKVCIVSNASKKRVIKFNERLKLNAIHRASKPGTKAFLKAARLLDFKNHNIAVVGDQIFTDIYGGNKAGMKTILVKPIKNLDNIFIMMKRIPEKLVLARYKRKSEK
jgi:HAD superfamily phosphatase (TIGR01668 family)